MNTEIARFNMIEQQIRPWEVLDPAVLSLLGRVRREDFVPTGLRALAFVDTQIPLLTGTAARQAPSACMLEPKVEARLLQELQLRHHERVLEIGTGSGFMAALLAHMCQRVYTLECRPELAAMARANLRNSGVDNVKVIDVSAADGAKGLPNEGPFDAIVLSGSVAAVPDALLQQLKVGGRLVAVVGDEPVMRARLTLRATQAGFSQTELFDTVVPRLEGFAQPSRFQF